MDTINQFENKINEFNEHLIALKRIYKSQIGLINSLKEQSKNCMNQMSSFEDVGLGSSQDTSLDKEIKTLSNGIETFNSEIGYSNIEFDAIIEKMISCLNIAIDNYSAEKGQMTKMLEVRKQMLYLDALIQKVKLKISSLLLMNNALLALSPEIIKLKDEYRSNLISINTSMLSADEECRKIIVKIEGLS